MKVKSVFNDRQQVSLSFSLLLLLVAAALSDDGSADTAVTASPGDIALLPCYSTGNVTPTLTTWTRNGQEVARGGSSAPSPPSDGQRLGVLHDGSLNIRGVIPGDEGGLPVRLRAARKQHLQGARAAAGGPENVSTSIGPATALSNGTLVVYRGVTVSFNCSSLSYPSQQLTWAFSGASSSNESLISKSGSWLDFKIEEVQPSAQGLYSCTANNTISYQTANRSTQLLVYYTPDRHPECTWALAQDPSHVQFNCTWFGAYPTPMLRWGVEQGHQRGVWEGHVYASEVTDSLSMTLNRSVLSDGETLSCMAQHQALTPGKDKCSFTLKATEPHRDSSASNQCRQCLLGILSELPYPEGEPLAAALEATSVTLTCTEATSMPPANTTWRRGLQQEEIVPGSKYVLSEEGPVLKLTILNVSKEDEGIYFCRSENPLDVRELEVYLTVRTASSVYTGAVIGVFIAALIVGLAAIVAKTVYSRRHRICLGGGFGQIEEDRGDVLSLVESDDEQIFQDAVPRLPPLTNGRHTTLVQIHRIPSSDHEDAETADTSQQQQEDTAQTEEPVDLSVAPQTESPALCGHDGGTLDGVKRGRRTQEEGDKSGACEEGGDVLHGKQRGAAA
ncbi:hypothetical protein L3Q82_006836 [Scortum barcoo]|uniref:Uncharacterized protein n=1 Tax=Scortum barcoo TaxID=214431 RepID=A0ACB8WVX6_9TELE|nr:hypothetical protein L3Q82_006836 [Scortum barcoo]